MKNIIKKIVISILLILPIYIQADTFDNEVNSTNEYLYRSDYRNDYDRYLLDGQRLQIMFGFKGGKIELSSKFTMGGFISNDEYEITKINGSSYLYEGIEYWTLTGNNAGDKYKVIGETEEKGKSEIYRNRTTEYVMSNIKVTGSGTSKDPWVFVPIYKVGINAQNGTVEYPNGNLIDRDLINKDETLKIIATPKSGYRYITNDCGVYLVNYNEATREASIGKLNKDLECNIIFGLGLYKIQIGDTGEVVEPKTIYSRYKEGFYKDNVGQNVIRNLTKLPTKVGYTYKGHEYIDGQGTKTQIIDQTGKIDNTKSGLITEDTTLKSKWEANKYTVTFNANGGEVAQTTMQVTFDSQYGTLPVAKKLGSGFDGWYTAATGGTKITNTTIVNTANDHILYAHYTQCTAGNYTNGTTGVCTGCPSGYTVAAGAGTSIDNCYMSVAQNNYVKNEYDASATPCNTGYESSAHTVLYGKTSSCTAKKVTVTFNKNDGSNVTATDTFTYAVANQTFRGTPTTWTRNGFRLLGWSSTSTGAVEYSVNSPVTNEWINSNSPTKVLYAVWQYLSVTADSYCCGSDCSSTDKILRYTGECEYVDEGNSNWRIRFLTSGDLTLDIDLNLDIFMVAAGYNGGGVPGHSDTYNERGGSGGRGGKNITQYAVTVASNIYPLVIGQSGGEASTGFGITTADGVNGAAGGRGGTIPWSLQYGCLGDNPDYMSYPGSSGVYAFGDSTVDTTRYSAGGGGGGSVAECKRYGASGGATGGGNGGNCVYTGESCGTAPSGKPNTGGGGGGGGAGSLYAYGGKGGSGIIIIRNKR